MNISWPSGDWNIFGEVGVGFEQLQLQFQLVLVQVFSCFFSRLIFGFARQHNEMIANVVGMPDANPFVALFR